MMMVRHMGDIGSDALSKQISHSIRQDVSARTGLDIEPELFATTQRGYLSSSGEPGNVYQLHCGRFGVWIDTTTFPHISSKVACPDELGECAGGPQVGQFYVFPEPVSLFETTGSLLRLSVDAAVVQQAAHSIDSDLEMHLVAIFQHAHTHEHVAIVAEFYSLKPAEVDVLEPVYLGDVFQFAKAPLLHGNDTTLFSLMPGSAQLQSNQAWTSEKTFGVEISAANLLAALGQKVDSSAQNIHATAQHWRLKEVAVNVEVEWLGHLHNEMQLGAHWQNFTVTHISNSASAD